MWRALRTRDRVLATGGAVMVGGLAIAAVLALFDSRLVLGVNPWIKPLKFFASIAIFLWTTAWFMPDTQPWPRARVFVRWSVLMSMMVEIALISLQAARGTTSHFNVGTLFDGVVFQVMGMFIVLNTVASMALLLIVRRDTPPERAGYLWGVRLGLALFILGSLEAVFMLRQMGHTVPGPDGGPGLPLVNWSADRGDLRIAHFVGIHAMQGLPLAGWLLDRARGALAGRVTAVVMLAAVWLVAVVWQVRAALQGQPLFHF